ncbi:sugar phosphate isomerase/epimerase family protein [Gemmata sp. JC717]|uniref:sugar phosphate isomerase/epimerase family protein n=1 Tax=Gemmata algarum TaxID=2975278 RepID=UPI0021BB072A|nr:sugar phosphate isomerase/epimerase family protein [Gemmata algarum]MDY3553227.1 sugar phosphate isomerase/epimerase family protein [Gemmata algarum]
MNRPLGRRDFLRTTAAAAAALTGPYLCGAEVKKPKLKKAVKYGMVRLEGGTHLARLELAKRCGFQGVEIDSPGTSDLDALVKASKETGVAIHGVVDSVHWRDTLSHPDEKIRAKGLDALRGALEDAKTVGADTVLLVPGVVNKDVTYQQCYERSQAEVKKVLPLAEKLKVKIAIEVVWNNFITKPEQLIQYVDDFKSEYVGAYFDCSNMIKYGVAPADWIRKLGKRMLKFDFKGYSKSKEWVAIGEGDENWPDVLAALGEIGYDGWATAEVGGGGEEHLKKIAAQMDKVLGLAQ